METAVAELFADDSDAVPVPAAVKTQAWLTAPVCTLLASTVPAAAVLMADMVMGVTAPFPICQSPLVVTSRTATAIFVTAPATVASATNAFLANASAGVVSMVMVFAPASRLVTM